MKDRISTMNWQVTLDEKRKKVKTKYKVLAFIESILGKSLFVFSNNKIIRK